MKSTLLLLICLASLAANAQTKVVSVAPNGRQRVIDLDSVYLAKGQVSFFRGTETGHILVNTDGKTFLKTWVSPDTIQLNNGRNNHFVFVHSGDLGTLQNEWRDYVISEDGWRGPYGIFRTDSSTINIGGEPHRQYILYFAEMKYKLGAVNSAGIERRLVYNWYYSPTNPNWHNAIPWVELRRWIRRL